MTTSLISLFVISMFSVSSVFAATPTEDEQAKLDSQFLETFEKMGACRKPPISERDFQKLSKAATELLGRGANVNVKSKNESTPLLGACCEPRVVRYLVAKGADVNARSSSGYMPLQTCTKDFETFQFLINHGAQLEPAKADTMLLSAVYVQNFKLIEMLIERGATDAGKATAMCGAMSLPGKESTDVLEVMINRGVAIDGAEPKQADTPLICAVRQANVEAVTILLSKGADSTQKNKNQESAASLAQAPSKGGPDEETRRKQIRELLGKK
jgi:ankyrin repeat protein